MKFCLRVLCWCGTIAGGLHAQSPAIAGASLLAADRALAAEVAMQPFASAIPDAMTSNAVLVWPAAAVVRTPAAARALLVAQPTLTETRIS